MAQKAVSERNQTAALDHIRQALANAGAIQKQMPSASPVLVPVSTEIDTTTTYRPVKPSKDEELRLKHDSSIRGVEAVTTTSNLNVSAAAASLQTAQTALKTGDRQTASLALDAVSKSVVQSQSTGDEPLVMARQNLQLALARVQSGKYHDAAVPLRSAAEALADYEKQTPGQHDSVELVREQIMDCADRIAHHHGLIFKSVSNAWLIYRTVAEDRRPVDSAE